MADVIWSEQDLEDLDATCLFIARDAPTAAKMFAYKAFEASDLLQEFPLMGRIVPELNQANLRELILGNYRLIYTFDPKKDQAAVLTLLHGARLFPRDDF